MYSQDGVIMTTAEVARRARGEQSINAIHFDQESPYPIRRVQQPSPKPPASPLGTPQPLSATSESSTSTDGRTVGTGARKSILKSWRSNASLSSASASDGRPSVEEREIPPSMTRRRRPSMVDIGRNSRTSSALQDGPGIPPSPMLPEQYVRPATNGSGAVSYNGGGRMTPRSSASSRRSSLSSPLPLPSRTSYDEDDTVEAHDSRHSTLHSSPLPSPYHDYPSGSPRQ